MKNHIIDATITAETITNVNTGLSGIEQEIATFSIVLDAAQRKHSLRIGTRNETFCREMIDLAREHPQLIPAAIDLAAIERDIAARDTLTPMLFRLKALTRQVEDTHIALGVDIYNGSRAMYKAVKPLGLISGVAEIITRIGQRFAGQGRRKPAPETGSLDSSTL
jgi:hypothetical protein